MRTRTNPNGTLVVEIDIELDMMVTFVFTRGKGVIVYRGAFCDYTTLEGRVLRVRYAGPVYDVVLSVARERALKAYAEHDKVPDSQRRA